MLCFRLKRIEISACIHFIRTLIGYNSIVVSKVQVSFLSSIRLSSWNLTIDAQRSRTGAKNWESGSSPFCPCLITVKIEGNPSLVRDFSDSICRSEEHTSELQSRENLV